MADYLPKAEQLDTMNARLAELNEHLQKREDFTAAMAKLDSATKKAESLKDGFSPTATVTQTSTGADVSITDKNGTTNAHIENGSDANVTKENVVSALGYTPLENAPVTSVNGKTGAVELAASDVGAISSTDGSVQNAHLASGAVTTDKLAEAERMTSANITNALGYEPEKPESPYEFINSVTATEDVAAIDVCKDADGNTFNLKHVYAVITQDGSITSDQYASTYIRCYNSTGGTIAIYIYAAYVFSSTKKYVVMWGHNYGERVEYEYQSYSTENDGSGELTSYKKQCKFIPNAQIYSVFIGSGLKIKKGTTVTVYGIRA